MNLTAEEQKIADAYHILYYKKTRMTTTRWFGSRVVKPPSDMFIYHDIICQTRPDYLVECGTKMGGSAYFFATTMDVLNTGQVITIDIRGHLPPKHPRITSLKGPSTSRGIIFDVTERVAGCRVMVSLDSDHSKDHVLEELRLYAPLVSVGCYLVLEDTALNGNPIWPEFGPGPNEALQEWLPQHPEFEQDLEREYHLMSCAPGGWLKRVEPGVG